MIFTYPEKIKVFGVSMTSSMHSFSESEFPEGGVEKVSSSSSGTQFKASTNSSEIKKKKQNE